jgi:hypothetical protein
VVRVNPSAQLKPGDTIRVLAHYKTDYLGTFVLQLQEGDAQPAFTKLQIEVSSKGNGASGGSRITWGRTGVCKVLGSFTTSAGVEITTDLTQVAEIVSSKPEELPLDPSAKGLLRTTKTFGGSTYTLTARYKNLTAQAPVVIEKVQASLEIRNALGDPLRGQPVTVRAALVAPSLVDDIPIKADWGSTSPALTISRSNVSEITIMTEGLPTGSYSIQARTEFRGMGENTIITAQHTFAVLDSVMRMELLTKTPILSFQSRGVFVLRLYNRNNSYTVIDPRKITWSTSSPELRIDPQGVVTPTERSIKDGKITPYTVYGDYLGQRVSASIAISPTNTINGSQAQLSHIVINGKRFDVENWRAPGDRIL